MKAKISFHTIIPLCTLIILACNNGNETNAQTEKKDSPKEAKKEKRVSGNSHIDIQAPNFADPQIKKYYSNYTAYLKKVVTAIRNQDEAGTMKIFREEGKQFDNRNEMDQKAKTEEEQKFTTWLMQSYPYQTEIIKSDYYKKYTEEYYKKVKEDFDKKNN